MPNLDAGGLAERLRSAVGGQSEAIFVCLLIMLAYISKGWVRCVNRASLCSSLPECALATCMLPDDFCC